MSENSPIDTGSELKLLPLFGPDYWLALSMFNALRRNDLWQLIGALPRKELPSPLTCYLAQSSDGETVFGEVTETPYGHPLTYTTARDLLTVREHEGVQDNWQNKAIWAYLAEMPPEWQIVLYWH